MASIHGQAGEHAAGAEVLARVEIGWGFAEGEVDRGGGTGGDVDVVAVDGHGRGRGIDGSRLVKLPVSAAVPALPFVLVPVVVDEETSAVLMSVPAFAVKVAV